MDWEVVTSLHPEQGGIKNINWMTDAEIYSHDLTQK